MNIEDEIVKRITQKLSAEIDKEILADYFGVPGGESMQYGTHQQQVDPEYLYNIKQKTEILLQKIVEKYKFNP